MPRLFGTDGIRGVANVDLKPTTAFALGRATAHRLVGPGGSIVVGQDTRRSGDMFVAAIAAGATSLGRLRPRRRRRADAGPGVPRRRRATIAAGIMVSASHNPAEDNGLKVLDAEGLKLDDAVEDELEQLIWRTEELPGAAPRDLGVVVDAHDRLERYVAHREALAADDRRRRGCASSSIARTARPARSPGGSSSATGATRRGHQRRSPTA